MTTADNAETRLLWNKNHYYPDLLSQIRISSSKAGLRMFFSQRAGLSDFSLVFLTETSIMLTAVISDNKSHIAAFKKNISKGICFTFFTTHIKGRFWKHRLHQRFIFDEQSWPTFVMKENFYISQVIKWSSGQGR